MKLWRFVLSSIFCVLLVIGLYKTASAQAVTDTPTPSVSPVPDTSSEVTDLQHKISELQGKISGLQSQEKTFSSQITVMNSQISLTEYKMQSTQGQINGLTKNIGVATKKVTNLEGSLTDVTKVLLARIVANYEIGAVQPVQVLVTSSDVSDFLKRANYLHIAQAHDKHLIYATQQAKNDYANQKNIFEDEKARVEGLKKQLQDYATELDVQKDEKKKLLSQTQGNEENYQKILAQTQAQLNRFSGFVTSQGGASLLSGQTVCDDWGCYYNQRDSQWGGTALNGTQYTLASDGCLVTSMAMVYTHYGHKDITPQSINSNSSNFDGIPAALLKFSISANGTSASRAGTDIDSTLASGNPVIIGISYDGGPSPDHFLVLISGSGGNYQMNDPYTAGGHNISFRGRYPSVRIVSTYKVNI